MTTITTQPAAGVVLNDVSWDYYERTLRELGEQHVRITYDRGRMEIMSPSVRHEPVKHLIGRLLAVYAMEKDVAIDGLGSVTCRRADLERGLEPDECYYIQSPAPAGDELDLTSDPPPDLAIEVDITSGSIPRQPITGALGVPEIWRYDGKQITALHRQADGTYLPASHSLALPTLSLSALNRFLKQGLAGDRHAALKAFGQWLGEN